MMEVHPSESRLLLALDRELDAEELATIDAHVRTCADCRATWDRFARLSEEIAEYCRALPSPFPSSPVPAPVPVSVAASRVRAERVAAKRVAASRMWKWPVAVAAAAVLVVGVMWHVHARMTAAPASGSIRDGAAPVAAPVTAPVTAASRHQQDMPLVSLPGVARDGAAQVARLSVPGVSATPVPPRGSRSRPRPSASAPRPAVQARAGTRKPTYYWALPYSNGALPLSEGSVVMTVRLSRDQLRLAGIPVNAMQPVTDQPWVRAKVLVGADGLPRAIALDQD